MYETACGCTTVYERSLTVIAVDDEIAGRVKNKHFRQLHWPPRQSTLATRQTLIEAIQKQSEHRAHLAPADAS